MKDPRPALGMMACHHRPPQDSVGIGLASVNGPACPPAQQRLARLGMACLAGCASAWRRPPSPPGSVSRRTEMPKLHPRTGTEGMSNCVQGSPVLVVCLLSGHASTSGSTRRMQASQAKTAPGDPHADPPSRHHASPCTGGATTMSPTTRRSRPRARKRRTSASMGSVHAALAQTRQAPQGRQCVPRTIR